MIQRVTVVDVTGAPSRPHQTVLIAAGRIVAVGSDAEVGIPRGAVLVDGAGKFLIPGLWDMHTHPVGYGDIKDQLTLKLSLANGVTGVRDMGSHPYALAKQWRDSIAAGTMIGPRMRVAGPIVENPRWLANVRRWEEEAGKSTEWMQGRFGPSTVEAARSFVDSVVALGADHIKVRNWPAAEVSEALVARARERGIPVVAHGSRPFPATGISSLEHMIFPPLQLPESGRDSLFRRWGAEGVAFVPTLVASFSRLHPIDSVLRWIDPARTPKLRYAPRSVREGWRQELEIGAKNERPFDWKGDYQVRLRDLREMRRAGVRILAGSDFGGPLTVPGFDLHEELAKLVDEVGMTPIEALRAATLAPAQFLGIDSLGTVASGKLADLVLLDADPRIDIRHTRRIHAVVANGRLFNRAALDGLIEEARRAAAR